MSRLSDLTLFEFFKELLKRTFSTWNVIGYGFYIFGYSILPDYEFISWLFAICVLQLFLFELYKCSVAYLGLLNLENGIAIIHLPILGKVPLKHSSLLYVTSEETFYLIFKGKLSLVAQPLLFQDKRNGLKLINDLRKLLHFEKEVSAKWLISFYKGNYSKLESSSY